MGGRAWIIPEDEFCEFNTVRPASHPSGVDRQRTFRTPSEMVCITYLIGNLVGDTRNEPSITANVFSISSFAAASSVMRCPSSNSIQLHS